MSAYRHLFDRPGKSIRRARRGDCSARVVSRRSQGRRGPDVAYGSTAWLDRLVLTPDHLWTGANRQWDPEGLLSTLPALGTTLFGVWAGRMLLAEHTPLEKTVRLFAWGVALVIGGVCQLLGPGLGAERHLPAAPFA